jgi:probable rRNA maturation factor
MVACDATEQDPPDAQPPEPPHQVFIANEQSTLVIDESRLVAAVQSVLAESSFQSAIVSVAVVDDPTIHDLNRRYLQHDYPTDVLSFVLEDDGRQLHGELVVSADMAAHNAVDYGWSAADELLLYLVHGTLHLVGHRDKQPADIAAMRQAEAAHLKQLGIAIPAEHSAGSEDPRR